MIKLIQGDCLEEIKHIPKEKHIIVSDPPFNIKYKYNSYNDNMSEKEYYKMLSNVFSKFIHVIILYPEILYKYASITNLLPNKVVSWVYNSNTPRQHRDIAFFGVVPDFFKCKQPYKNPTDARIKEKIIEGKTARLYDWWEINQVKNVSKEKTKHPCQMPIEVMKRIICILPDDVTILDPFMGSGTTGVACKLLNRNFIGIEIDRTYFEIAQKRIASTRRIFTLF